MAALAVAVLGGAAHAQSHADGSSVELVRKFHAYLASVPYSTFLAEKILAYDQQMPPACKERRLTGDRRLFAVTQLPRFVKTRNVPVAGEWAERVEVQRCGRRVWHNVYLKAYRVRGLHAVVGFPGRSLTDLKLQLRAGRSFLKQVRKARPGCKHVDVIATRVSERPARRGAPWSEVWTAWLCGQLVTRPIRFAPRGKRVDIQVQ